ncbi:MAG TPA: NAD-dependent epimerase/dehydratase family protein, partial [Kiloniellaceae bacterium]|nr:NAD-dependent epimerase/dehydratase family protein [Kiloniellaceae bacterium]
MSESARGPVLVTGANGFLGRHICRALLARGYAVRGSLRQGRPRDLAEVDYREVPPLAAMPDWRPHLEGCHAVVHTAARVHIRAKESDAEERRHHLLENANA